LQALSYDAAFVRITKGLYAIRALMGDVPYESIGRPQPKKKAAVDPQMVPGPVGNLSLSLHH